MVRAKVDEDGKTGNWVNRLPIPGLGAENVFRLISSATGSPIGQFISSPVTFLHSVDPRIKLVIEILILVKFLIEFCEKVEVFFFVRDQMVHDKFDMWLS